MLGEVDNSSYLHEAVVGQLEVNIWCKQRFYHCSIVTFAVLENDACFIDRSLTPKPRTPSDKVIGIQSNNLSTWKYTCYSFLYLESRVVCLNGSMLQGFFWRLKTGRKLTLLQWHKLVEWSCSFYTSSLFPYAIQNLS